MKKILALLVFALTLLVPSAVAQTTYEPVVYPAQQTAVGNAALSVSNGTYTFSNNLFSASFVQTGDQIKFGGCSAMSLKAGTELFTVTFGDGTTVKASQLTSPVVTSGDLTGSDKAVKGSDHYNGKYLQAVYTYTKGEATLTLTWRAELRDGSHYLRTDLTVRSNKDIAMKSFVPMQYIYDTTTGGTAPEKLGNVTYGNLLMNDKIFAGLETPMGQNSVGDSDGETYTAFPNVSGWTKDLMTWTPSSIPSALQSQDGVAYTAANYLGTQGLVTFSTSGSVTATFQYQTGACGLWVAGIELVNPETGTVESSNYNLQFTGGGMQQISYTLANVEASKVYLMRFYYDSKKEGAANRNTSNGNITWTSAPTAYTPTGSGAADKYIKGLWSRNTTLYAYAPDTNGELGKDMEWNVSTVVGLVNPAQKRRSYLAYHERERAVPWRPFPLYNSWYELNINRKDADDPANNMTTAQAVGVVNQWKEHMYNVYGEGIQAYVWDDGWDQYGTWEPHANFTNGFAETDAIAKTMNTGIGCWLGPRGGYGHSADLRRKYWTDRGSSHQLSQPDFFKAFMSACSEKVKNYDFRFFKFDGISTLGTAYGPQNEEDAEGIITVERLARKMREDLFFNTTVGTWASPFWFHFADAIWRQENDHGTIGTGANDREKWITYRDNLVHKIFTAPNPYCPINSIMTHGFILSTHGGSSDRSYNSVLNELRCAFCSGDAMVELYADADLLNTINGGILWEKIAECIKWQKDNADVLPDVHWVGGDPWDETNNTHNIYGWASWNGTKATLTLRNGDPNEKTYTTTLREALDIPSSFTGKIYLKAAFGDQFGALKEICGIDDNTAIDPTQSITFTLPGSSVYVFNGKANAPVETVLNTYTVTTTDMPNGATVTYKGAALGSSVSAEYINEEDITVTAPTGYKYTVKVDNVLHTVKVTFIVPLTFESAIKDGATYAFVNIQPTNPRKMYYLYSDGTALKATSADECGANIEWATTAQFVAIKQEGENKYAFKNVANDQYLAYKKFIGNIDADLSVWTAHDGTRSEFSDIHTFWFGVNKRSSSEGSGSIILKNDGTFDNCSAAQFSNNTTYSNNYGLVLVEDVPLTDIEKAFNYTTNSNVTATQLAGLTITFTGDNAANVKLSATQHVAYLTPKASTPAQVKAQNGKFNAPRLKAAGETPEGIAGEITATGETGKFSIAFPEDQITEGDYEVTIPAGTFYVGTTAHPVAELKANYTVEETEPIVADNICEKVNYKNIPVTGVPDPDSQWKAWEGEAPEIINGHCSSTDLYVMEKHYEFNEESNTLRVTFQHQGGNHRTDIVGVDVIAADGTTHYSDYHHGFTGNAHDANVYTINNIPEGVYTVRYIVTKHWEEAGKTTENNTQIKGYITNWNMSTPENGKVYTIYNDHLGAPYYVSKNQTKQNGYQDITADRATDGSQEWIACYSAETGYTFYNRADNSITLHAANGSSFDYENVNKLVGVSLYPHGTATKQAGNRTNLTLKGGTFSNSKGTTNVHNESNYDWSTDFVFNFTGEYAYKVEIEDGQTVTFNDATYQNGDFIFTGNKLVDNTGITASPKTGATSSIAVSDGLIKVTYDYTLAAGKFYVIKNAVNNKIAIYQDGNGFKYKPYVENDGSFVVQLSDKGTKNTNLWGTAEDYDTWKISNVETDKFFGWGSWNSQVQAKDASEAFSYIFKEMEDGIYQIVAFNAAGNDKCTLSTHGNNQTTLADDATGNLVSWNMNSLTDHYTNRWVVEEVEGTLYTIALTGQVPAATSVTINGKNYSNGQKVFTTGTLEASNVTVNAPAGYEITKNIADGTITVHYATSENPAEKPQSGKIYTIYNDHQGTRYYVVSDQNGGKNLVKSDSEADAYSKSQWVMIGNDTDGYEFYSYPGMTTKLNTDGGSKYDIYDCRKSTGYTLVIHGNYQVQAGNKDSGKTQGGKFTASNAGDVANKLHNESNYGWSTDFVFLPTGKYAYKVSGPSKVTINEVDYTDGQWCITDELLTDAALSTPTGTTATIGEDHIISLYKATNYTIHITNAEKVTAGSAQVTYQPTNTAYGEGQSFEANYRSVQTTDFMSAHDYLDVSVVLEETADENFNVNVTYVTLYHPTWRTDGIEGHEGVTRALKPDGETKYMIFDTATQGTDDWAGFMYPNGNKVGKTSPCTPLEYKGPEIMLWTVEDAHEETGDGYYLKNVGTGKYYDGYGNPHDEKVVIYIQMFPEATMATADSTAHSVNRYEEPIVDIKDDKGCWAIGASREAMTVVGNGPCWNGPKAGFTAWWCSSPFAFYEICELEDNLNSTPEIKDVLIDYCHYFEGTNDKSHDFGTFQQKVEDAEALELTESFTEYVRILREQKDMTVSYPQPITVEVIDPTEGTQTYGPYGRFITVRNAVNLDYLKGNSVSMDRAVMWLNADNELVSYDTGLGYSGTDAATAIAGGKSFTEQTLSDVSPKRGTLVVKTSDNKYLASGGDREHGTSYTSQTEATTTNATTWYVDNADYVVATIPASGYTTFYAPVPFAVPDGVEAYIITADEGQDETGLNICTLTLNSIGFIPAQTAVVLAGEQGAVQLDVMYGTYGSESEKRVRADEDSYWVFPEFNEYVAATNVLKGYDYTCTNQQTSASDGVDGKYIYTLSNGKFQYYTGATIKAFKCFLELTQDYRAGHNRAATNPFRIIINGETEGISGTKTSSDNNAFDLSGRRINVQSERGLYILNGKKVIR